MTLKDYGVPLTRRGAREGLGVVLAGGKGRRLGLDKPFVRLGGETLLERAIARLGRRFSDIIVVADLPDRFRHLSVRCVADRFPGLGPVGAIAAALETASGRGIFAVACDMPFLEPEIIGRMVDLSEGYDLVVPSVSGRLHPLHAFYGPGCLPPLAAQIKAGNLALHHLAQAVKTRIVTDEAFQGGGPLLRSLFNINTPDDLKTAERMLEAQA